MARVLLQMGHCFRKTGATGTNGIDGDPSEQEFAQAACLAAAPMLRTAGHSPVVMDADEPSSMYAGYDAFVAVHCDGSTSEGARGASIGYRTAEGAHLGAVFKQAYADLGWKGFRPDNYTAALAGYYGVREAVQAGTLYAVIIEAGFLTNPTDEALLTPPGGSQRLARSITAAVNAVFGAPQAQEARRNKIVDMLNHPGDERVDALYIGPGGETMHKWALDSWTFITEPAAEAGVRWGIEHIAGGFGTEIAGCWEHDGENVGLLSVTRGVDGLMYATAWYPNTRKWEPWRASGAVARL